MNNKVAIIGSGIAGIATSIRLKAKGFDVTVYEKNSFPGGKLSSFKLGEFRFDAGPSLFTMPQYVDELFEISGENPKDHFKYKRKKIACKYFWEDESIFNAYSDKEKFYNDLQVVYKMLDKTGPTIIAGDFNARAGKPLNSFEKDDQKIK